MIQLPNIYLLRCSSVISIECGARKKMKYIIITSTKRTIQGISGISLSMLLFLHGRQLEFHPSKSQLSALGSHCGTLLNTSDVHKHINDEWSVYRKLFVKISYGISRIK